MSKYKLAVSVVSTKHADAAVLGYPVRGKILQGFSSPDEVSNGARIGDSVIIRSGVVIYEDVEISRRCGVDQQKTKHMAKAAGG